MKKSRYSEEQIIRILKQSEAGVKTPDLCREHGISAATFYGWKQKFGGMVVSEAQRLKAMEDENRRLKLLVSELSLHGEALKAVILKTGGACRSKRGSGVRVSRVPVKRTHGLQAAGRGAVALPVRTRPDRNVELRGELVKLARQKPRYGYRRLHALLSRRGQEVNVKRVYKLYVEEKLMVRRKRRKRLVRERPNSRLRTERKPALKAQVQSPPSNRQCMV